MRRSTKVTVKRPNTGLSLVTKSESEFSEVKQRIFKAGVCTDFVLLWVAVAVNYSRRPLPYRLASFTVIALI